MTIRELIAALSVIELHEDPTLPVYSMNVYGRNVFRLDHDDLQVEEQPEDTNGEPLPRGLVI